MDKKASATFVDPIDIFKIGDFVTPLSPGSDNIFYGIILDICKKEYKVYVEWSGGLVKQHDPTEIHLHPYFMDEKIYERYRNRLRPELCVAALTETPNRPEVTNPDNRGAEKPVGGGFSIMQDLVHKDRQEQGIVAKINRIASKVADPYCNLQSRRAVYHHEVGRVYRRSQGEVEKDTCVCPKCKSDMERQSFIRGVKIYICPDCLWKITTDKLV